MGKVEHLHRTESRYPGAELIHLVESLAQVVHRLLGLVHQLHRRGLDGRRSLGDHLLFFMEHGRHLAAHHRFDTADAGGR